MDFEYSLKLEGKFLKVTVWGDYDHGRAIEAFDEVMAVATEKGVAGVLFDCEELNADDKATMEQYEYSIHVVDRLAEVRRNPEAGPMRLAYFGRPNPEDLEDFGETVAQNRGGNARFFTEKEEAEAWLRDAVVGHTGGREDR